MDDKAASGQLSLPQLEARGGVALPQDHLLLLESTLQVAEGDPGLRLDSVDVEPGCEIGDNFSSIVTRETALGVRGDGSEYRRSVVVKRAPPAEMFRSSEMFWKEAFSYSVLLPALRRARGALPLPFPECLHASLSRPNTIILEDLRPLGFVMADRQAGMDVQSALSVMEALGRFHGASLALRRTDPLAFRRVRARLRELTYYRGGEAVFGPSFQSSILLAGMSLRRSGRPDLARRLAARAPTAFQQVCDTVAPPPEGGPVEPCFGHGDFWINNILLKYTENGRVEDVRFLDIAATRCSSPAIDILHFMYTSITSKVRNKHKDALLRRYRDSLQATVTELVRSHEVCPSLPASPNSVDSLTLSDEMLGEEGEDLSIEDQDAPPVRVVTESVLSMDSLKHELEVRAAFALWHGLWMMPAIFFDLDCLPRSDEPINYYAEDTLSHLCSHLPQAFHRRIVEHVEEFSGLGLV